MLRIPVRRVDPAVPLPSYRHPGDAGLDLHCVSDVVVPPLSRAVVGTGIVVALPDGYAGLVAPRSGLAARQGLSVVNAPGIVDAGYRGEIRVILLNTDAERPIELKRGDRIAQLLVVPVAACELVEVDELPATTRGDAGFGSTGL